MNLKTAEIMGYIGIIIMASVLVYLLLKILGVFHSPGFEEILTATLIGQLFYTGYAHRYLKEIEHRLKRIEKKLKL